MDIEKLVGELPVHEQEKILSWVSTYKDALERERCEQSFLPFVKKMWPSFVHGRHHAVMAKAFEDVASGKIKRLAISCPPRHTKSQFGSFLFPAWFLGKFPDKKVMQSSNTSELAVGFGRNVRNLVMSEEYSKVFPNVKLRQDSKSAGRWAVNQYGEYFAIGVGGTMTGRGADCLVGNTMVMTYNGTKRIDEVSENEYVLSRQNNRSVYRRVVAVARRTVYETYRIYDDLGNMVEATGNHRIFCGNDWKETKAIHTGDVLLCNMQEGLPEGSVRNSQEAKERSELCSPLRSILRDANKKFKKWLQGSFNLQQLWQGNVVWSFAGGAGVFGRVPTGDFKEGRIEIQNNQRANLRNLREGLQTKEQYLRIKVLLNWLQKRIAFNPNAGGEQSNLEGWSNAQEGKGKNRSELQGCKEERNEDGLRNVCGMQHGTSSRGASYQSQPSRQQVRESGDAMFLLPSQVTRNEHEKSGTVSLVERVRHPEGIFVYDIEVEETHNFFANNVLVHNCIIIDDPHSEQEAALASHDASVYDSVYEWYTSGPRQRLQPNGAIIIIATRWSERDLIGRVLKDAAERGKEDEWRVIEFPAILPSGNPLWPEFWSLEELSALKEELPPSKWNAQYQQSPTGEEGAIVKREWWKVWEKDDPPRCEFIIQSWDTAFTKNERSDFSACTTWGVFHMNENPEDVHIILLDAFKKRMEFPELKERAYELYMDWEPDACIVEAKAAGAPLIFELRQMGIMVSEYTPSRGNDKFVRLNSVTDLIRSGKVWAPDTRWARELIEEMAVFPNGQHDDLTDSATQALIRFRQGGFLRLESDEKEELKSFRRKHIYY